MIVRYLGSVSATTGERQLSWEKPATTLRDLLRDLAIHYGPRFKYWVLDRGNVPDEHIIVRINGRDARYLDGADTPLRSGDTISVASTMRLRLAT
jgi:molybdopterin synthase sulfur carrier subunit